MNFCINCKHHVCEAIGAARQIHLCTHPDFAPFDLVTGARGLRPQCSQLRQTTVCLKYEEKEEVK